MSPDAAALGLPIERPDAGPAAPRADRAETASLQRPRASVLLLRIASDVRTVDDLNDRAVATDESDVDRQALVEAAFRSLSLAPRVVALRADEATERLRTGNIAAIATLTDDAAAAQASGPVLKIRLDPYAVQPPRRQQP